MSKKPRGPYKKLLSIFEIEALVEEHRDSPVFITDSKGERSLEPWLKELRIHQALQVAQGILGVSIPQQEFEQCWARTKPPRKQQPADPQHRNLRRLPAGAAQLVKPGAETETAHKEKVNPCCPAGPSLFGRDKPACLSAALRDRLLRAAEGRVIRVGE